MKPRRQHIFLIALTVAISGFLPGFDVTANSGSVSFFKCNGLWAAAAFVFGLIWIPEAKGRTFEELEGLLVRK